MRKISNKILDQERALYAEENLIVESCQFDGAADGESALKECKNIVAKDCFFNLRYPFWHDDTVAISNCKMTQNCRAALWYCNDVKVENSTLHGIKALRECTQIAIDNCNVDSTEFAWFCNHLTIANTQIKGEYFALKCANLHLDNVTLDGKYSFQYATSCTISNCNLNTKDALWHAKDVVVKNCTLKGEYLAWYCENVTFVDCTIIGTQPLCYCKNLQLVNCTMIDTDLAFEKSEVQASINSDVVSIKNPISGKIHAQSIQEIILDYPTNCQITQEK